MLHGRELTVHKRHDGCAAFGQEADHHSSKVACSEAVQGPVLIKKGEKLPQETMVAHQGIVHAINLTTQYLCRASETV